MFACKKKQPPENPAVPVNLYSLKPQKVAYFDNYPSTTQAISQVDLLPQANGAITKILFKEGSHVEKGQKLYEIDSRIYRANYNAAVAALRVAQGNLLQAQQDADRYEYLNKYDAVAKQLYDHAMIALLNAKNQVKSAEDSVKTAKANLNYTVVYAPFSGTIGLSKVKSGDVVSAQTILNTISTEDPMALDFVINEKDLPHFEDLEKSKKYSDDSLFTILLPDNSLYPKTGKISFIDRAVDPQTGSIRVRLIFPNPDNFLKVGMSCVLRVHNQDTLPQLLVASKAVVEQMGEYFLYVARDTIIKNPEGKSEKGKSSDKDKSDEKDKSDKDKSDKDKSDTTKPKLVAVQKKVQVGQTVGPNTVIKSGVKAGDRIVVDGVQALHDGSQITTANVMGPDQSKNGKRQ